MRGFYNAVTREIQNVRYTCGRNKLKDLEFFHEYRHKLQHDADVFTIFFFSSFNVIFICSFLLLFNNEYMIIMALVPVFFVAAVEIDAWCFAFWMVIKDTKRKRCYNEVL